MIPDGRISRVRFEATTSTLCSFLSLDRLKPVVGIHPSSESLHTASPRCSAAVVTQCHLDPAYLPVALCAHRPFAREARPSHVRYYGLMCQSCCLPATMHGGSWLGPCRLDHPRLVIRTFPTLSLRIFPCVLGPLPRQLVRCPYPFLPPRHRPSPREDRVGAQPRSVQRLQYGALFRGCSHSMMFRPTGLLATQVAPTATATP
jgi:hypothetical protein